MGIKGLNAIQIQLTSELISIHKHTDVSGNEGDHKLFRFGALGPRLWYNILVQSLHCPLKACKLHHSVRDLTTPQRYDAFVEPSSHICNVRESTVQ